MHFISEDVLVRPYTTTTTTTTTTSTTTTTTTTSSMALQSNANHHLFNGLLSVRSVL